MKISILQSVTILKIWQAFKDNGQKLWINQIFESVFYRPLFLLLSSFPLLFLTANVFGELFFHGKFVGKEQTGWKICQKLSAQALITKESEKLFYLREIQQIVSQITLINFCVSVRFTIDIQTPWYIATTWKSLCLLTLKGITGRVRRNFFQFYGVEFFCRAKLIHIKNQTFSGQS